MAHPLNSRRLQHFLAVYEHHSFGRAAAEVHVTQPALSKSIQLLEEDLKVKLFERTASGVTPTIYGHALAQHAKVIQAEMQNAAREIATLSGAETGEVQVGATPSATADLIPRVYAKLQTARPGIKLRVVEGLMEDHVPALRRGELDVFVGGFVSGAHPDLTTEVVMKDEVRVFAGAGHPLARDKRVSLAALVEYPWILPPQTQFWLAMVEKSFISAGLKPPAPGAVTNSAGFIRAMLFENRFLSALPQRLMQVEVKSGLVAALNVEDMAVGVDITATYRRHAIRLSAFEVVMATLRKVGKS